MFLLGIVVQVILLQIYFRLGRCLLKQKRFTSSKEAFTKCLDMIGKGDLNTKSRDAFRAKTHKQMSVFNVNKKIVDTCKPEPTISEYDGHIEGLPGVSKLLDFDNEGKLEVFDPIKAGLPLVVERPLLAAVLPRPNADSTVPVVCPQTLKPMFAAVPCRLGSEEMFSCEEAREAAESSYHEREWRLKRPLEAVGASPVAMLGFRCATSMHPEQIKEAKDKEELDQEGDAKVARYRVLFRALEGNTNPESEVAAAVMSAFLLRQFRRVGHSLADQG